MFEPETELAGIRWEETVTRGSVGSEGNLNVSVEDEHGLVDVKFHELTPVSVKAGKDGVITVLFIVAE